MKKAIVILVLAVVLITITINQTKSTPFVADGVKDETVRGDIVELQGKSMFYKDKFNEYPIIPDSIYDNPDADVIWATQVFEEYLGKDRSYIEENIKLIDMAEMKSKGITYELANKKSKYYLDTLTGMVLSPELIESGDSDYIQDIKDNDGLYKVHDMVEIVETNNPSNVMSTVHGSYRSGSSMYFYGGGTMKYARRNESTREIINLDSELPQDILIEEILYIQPSTGRAAVKVGGNVSVIKLLK